RFRRVGDGRERVGGEDGERDPLAQPLVAGLGQRHRRADEHTLQQRESHAGPAWRRMSPESSPGWADGRPVSPAGGEFLRNFNGGGQPRNAGLSERVPEDQWDVNARWGTRPYGAR